jgi:uncharacterized protein YbbK (DUF523 family)
MKKIRLGISSCLLGENVRYNGGHALDRFLRDTLGKYVEYVPVCPEVECGFGIPRETLRLMGDPEQPRLVTSQTGIDYTDRMEAWARTRVGELENENLCGFIFKSDSPSSGMERVKIYNDEGVPRKIGVGVFARIFKEHFPLIPVEEDGRLHDPILRENFIDRIFTYRRYREIIERMTVSGVLWIFTPGTNFFSCHIAQSIFSRWDKSWHTQKNPQQRNSSDSMKDFLWRPWRLSLQRRSTPTSCTM